MTEVASLDYALAAHGLEGTIDWSWLNSLIKRVNGNDSPVELADSGGNVARVLSSADAAALAGFIRENAQAMAELSAAHAGSAGIHPEEDKSRSEVFLTAAVAWLGEAASINSDVVVIELPVEEISITR
jgi:hypothetical protein